MKRTIVVLGILAAFLLATFGAYAVENSTWGRIKATFSEPPSKASGDLSSSSVPASRLAKDTWTWHAEKAIGPEGGTLTTNLTRLIVPPGALDEPINLTLDVIAYAPVGLGGAINRTYQFGPCETVFNQPVTLELSFHDADLQGTDPNVLYMSYYDETTGTWEDLGGTVDVAGHRVFFSGQLPHFSLYGLAPR